MSGSFTFVPRQLSRKTVRPVALGNSKGKEKATEPLLDSPTVDATRPNEQSSSIPVTSARRSERSHSAQSDEELVMLVWLALSDYAIWSDPDLRRMLSQSAEGYVSLASLLKYSSAILHANYAKEEAAVAKALRACPSGLALFDVRLALATLPSGSSALTGNYEIRRKDWSSCEERLREYSRQHWEDASVYVENVPSNYLTLGNLAQFVASVTPPPITMGNSILEDRTTCSVTNVQRVVTLPHLLDKPGDTPQCKHFAVLILASPSHSTSLQTFWHWSLDSATRGALTEERLCSLGIKHGFRVISKAHWKGMTEEYVSHRDGIVKSLEVEEYETPHPSATTETKPSPAHRCPSPEETPDDVPFSKNVVEQPKTHMDSPYPYHCLLFVRNVHDQTNKTTLRKLFATHLGASFDPEKAIDYVDYTKGTDNCYLRFLSATEAETFNRVFSDLRIYQTNGLDEKGSSDKSADLQDAIQVEYVQGKREEIYWQRVPEKVRRLAVLKAIQGSSSPLNKQGPRSSDAQERPAKRRKRK